MCQFTGEVKPGFLDRELQTTEVKTMLIIFTLAT
jgi:hypothetical protein